MTSAPPPGSPPRLTSAAFPPYAFLPGRDPHPTRDPRGHSYTTEAETPPPPVDPESWRESEAYLFGVDLYNHGYLWEAHEAWEGLWHVSKHDPVQADFLQGLIQCAAAALKVHMDQPRGMGRLAELGVGRLETVVQRAGPEYMGLDVLDFCEAVRAFVASEPDSIDGRPSIVLG